MDVPIWRIVGGAVLLFLLLGGALLLATIPGRIARRRGHPSWEAIEVCGLIGVILPVLWLIAFIWAYTGPDRGRRSG